jgi:hypothetical protein
MKKTIRIAAATAAITASMGLAGLAVAAEAQAHPGPQPTWCPGEFWDPGWGNNWDWGGCHDNFNRGWGGPRDDFHNGWRGGPPNDFGRHDDWHR